MSQVSVRLFAGAAEAFGAPETELRTVGTVGELTTRLVETAAFTDPETARRLAEVLEQCSFFVDGEHEPSPDATLPANCRVDVLPPFAGG